jgi:hypothetical protein
MKRETRVRIIDKNLRNTIIQLSELLVSIYAAEEEREIFIHSVIYSHNP